MAQPPSTTNPPKGPSLIRDLPKVSLAVLAVILAICGLVFESYFLESFNIKYIHYARYNDYIFASIKYVGILGILSFLLAYVGYELIFVVLGIRLNLARLGHRILRLSAALAEIGMGADVLEALNSVRGAGSQFERIPKPIPISVARPVKQKLRNITHKRRKIRERICARSRRISSLTSEYHDQSSRARSYFRSRLVLVSFVATFVVAAGGAHISISLSEFTRGCAELLNSEIKHEKEVQEAAGNDASDSIRRIVPHYICDRNYHHWLQGYIWHLEEITPLLFDFRVVTVELARDRRVLDYLVDLASTDSHGLYFDVQTMSPVVIPKSNLAVVTSAQIGPVARPSEVPDSPMSMEVRRVTHAVHGLNATLRTLVETSDGQLANLKKSLGAIEQALTSEQVVGAKELTRMESGLSEIAAAVKGIAASRKDQPDQITSHLSQIFQVLVDFRVASAEERAKPDPTLLSAALESIVVLRKARVPSDAALANLESFFNQLYSSDEHWRPTEADIAQAFEAYKILSSSVVSLGDNQALIQIAETLAEIERTLRRSHQAPAPLAQGRSLLTSLVDLASNVADAIGTVKQGLKDLVNVDVVIGTLVSFKEAVGTADGDVPDDLDRRLGQLVTETNKLLQHETQLDDALGDRGSGIVQQVHLIRALAEIKLEAIAGDRRPEAVQLGELIAASEAISDHLAGIDGRLEQLVSESSLADVAETLETAVELAEQMTEPAASVADDAKSSLLGLKQELARLSSNLGSFGRQDSLALVRALIFDLDNTSSTPPDRPNQEEVDRAQRAWIAVRDRMNHVAAPDIDGQTTQAADRIDALFRWLEGSPDGEASQPPVTVEVALASLDIVRGSLSFSALRTDIRSGFEQLNEQLKNLVQDPTCLGAGCDPGGNQWHEVERLIGELSKSLRSIDGRLVSAEEELAKHLKLSKEPIPLACRRVPILAQFFFATDKTAVFDSSAMHASGEPYAVLNRRSYEAMIPSLSALRQKRSTASGGGAIRDHLLAVGYADSRGDVLYNLRLSEERAKNVSAVLSGAAQIGGTMKVEVTARGEGATAFEESPGSPDLRRVDVHYCYGGSGGLLVSEGAAPDSPSDR